MTKGHNDTKTDFIWPHLKDEYVIINDDFMVSPLITKNVNNLPTFRLKTVFFIIFAKDSFARS